MNKDMNKMIFGYINELNLELILKQIEKSDIFGSLKVFDYSMSGKDFFKIKYVGNEYVVKMKDDYSTNMIIAEECYRCKTASLLDVIRTFGKLKYKQSYVDTNNPIKLKKI